MPVMHDVLDAKASAPPRLGLLEEMTALPDWRCSRKASRHYSELRKRRAIHRRKSASGRPRLSRRVISSRLKKRHLQPLRHAGGDALVVYSWHRDEMHATGCSILVYAADLAQAPIRRAGSRTSCWQTRSAVRAGSRLDTAATFAPS